MFKKHPLAGLKLTLYPIRSDKVDNEVKTNNALRHQVQALQVRVTDLKGVLSKAEVVLLNYSPKDVWFPEVELQWAQLMGEIHNLLKR